MYRVKQKYADREALNVIVSKRWINLVGTQESKQVIPATEVVPRKEIIFHVPTQKDLEILFKKGSIYIEEYDKPTAAPTTEVKPTDIGGLKK